MTRNKFDGFLRELYGTVPTDPRVRNRIAKIIIAKMAPKRGINAIASGLERGGIKHNSEAVKSRGAIHVGMMDRAVDSVREALSGKGLKAEVSLVENAYVMTTARGDEHDEKEYLFEVSFLEGNYDEFYFIIGFKWFERDGEEYMRSGYSLQHSRPRLTDHTRHVF